MNRVIRKLKHTGSKPGKLNGWDRAKASITGSIWAVVTGFPTVLVLMAGQVEKVLPTIQANYPLWVGVLVGTIVAVIGYRAKAEAQRQADNRPLEVK